MKFDDAIKVTVWRYLAGAIFCYPQEFKGLLKQAIRIYQDNDVLDTLKTLQESALEKDIKTIEDVRSCIEILSHDKKHEIAYEVFLHHYQVNFNND